MKLEIAKIKQIMENLRYVVEGKIINQKTKENLILIRLLLKK